MGFSVANSCYAWGLQSSLRAWQAKQCFVINAQRICGMRKEWANEQMNQMPFQVGSVPPALQKAFVTLLLSEVLLDLLEINNAFFTFHALWHGPQPPTSKLPGALVKTADSWAPFPNYWIRISEDGIRKLYFWQNPSNSMVQRRLRSVRLCELYHHINKRVLSTYYVLCIFWFLLCENKP